MMKKLRQYLNGGDIDGVTYPKVIDVIAYSKKYSLSYGYLICDGFRRVHLVDCEDEAINRRIQKRREERERLYHDVHRDLKSWLFRLDDVDMAVAESTIEPLQPKQKGQEQPWTQGQYHKFLRDQIQEIADRRIRVWACRYGRLHSNVASLAKPLRRSCLKYRRQPLVETDLSNSQFVHLCLLADMWLTMTNAERNTLLHWEFSKGNKTYALFEHLLQKKREEERRKEGKEGEPFHYDCSFEATPPDQEGLSKICQAGRYYEEMAKGKILDEESREKYKLLCIKAVYSRDYDASLKCKAHLRETIELQERFCELSPTVSDLCSLFKQPTPHRRKNAHKHLARCLQNLEATMFMRICARIMREKPETIIILIHDAILTTADAEDYVRSVIMDEFRKVGMVPTLKPRKEAQQ